MELSPTLIGIISILRPRYAYSFHVCTSGIKINCDNDIFWECAIWSNCSFSYDYPTIQSLTLVPDTVSLAPTTITSRFLTISANPSHLPELSAPPVPEDVWVSVPREYLRILCATQQPVDISVSGMVSGNLSYGTQSPQSVRLAPPVAVVVSEWLGMLGGPYVGIAVGLDIAFGIRTVSQGGYFSGPRQVLWVPHCG